MTDKRKVERLRVLAGVLAAMLGIAGVFTSSWFTVAALAFAGTWIVLCIVSANLTVTEIVKEGDKA